MKYRAVVVVLNVVLCNSALAAHIATETRSGSTPIQRTDTYANSAGDLRIDDRGYGGSSSSRDEAGTSAATVTFELGDIEDTTLFQTRDLAVVTLEGNICRRLTADTPPPPGLGIPGMNPAEAGNQMADAMRQAGSMLEEAMAEARRDGMTAEQQRALEQFTKPFMEPQDIVPREALDITPLNQRIVVGKYSAEGYLVSDQDGVEKHRVWVVPTGQIAGGRQIRNAMLGMFNAYEEYLDKIGGRSLMDTEMSMMFRDGQLKDKYPVQIEDLESGEVTVVVEASNSGPNVEYYPDCIAKDMFEM